MQDPPSALVAILGAKPEQGAAAGPLFRCSAVQIGEDRVLTAAHCLLPDSTMTFVLMGAGDLCSVPDPADLATAVVETRDDRTDQLILRLSTTRSGFAPPAGDFTTHPGRRLIAYGWGSRTRDGAASCMPRRVELVAVEGEVCASVEVLRPLGHRLLCAVPSEGLNTCTGDSGGPVFDSMTRQLIAITSAGAGCDPRQPGSYSLVTRGSPPVLLPVIVRR